MNNAVKKPIPYGLFCILLTLDVIALLFEKIAADHAMPSPGGSGIQFYKTLVTQPWMWLGIGLGPIQLWIWTKILARTDLSLAFPVSSLSYPLTMIASEILLREKLSLVVWLGAILITIGVAIVGSSREKSAEISLEEIID
jgi:drug/metabolite transporter (DMT)-like permease